MTATLLPSAAALTVAWLKASAAVTAITAGRVGTKLNANLPAVRVQRVGGISSDVYEDQPLMQLECWASDETTADLLARTVRAELDSARGTYPTGRIYTYTVESGPTWMPDDPSMTNNSRYMLTVRLLTSP